MLDRLSGVEVVQRLVSEMCDKRDPRGSGSKRAFLCFFDGAEPESGARLLASSCLGADLSAEVCFS